MLHNRHSLLQASAVFTCTQINLTVRHIVASTWTFVARMHNKYIFVNSFCLLFCFSYKKAVFFYFFFLPPFFFFFNPKNWTKQHEKSPFLTSACLDINILVTQAAFALSAGPLLPPTVGYDREAPGTGSLLHLLSRQISKWITKRCDLLSMQNFAMGELFFLLQVNLQIF